MTGQSDTQGSDVHAHTRDAPCTRISRGTLGILGSDTWGQVDWGPHAYAYKRVAYASYYAYACRHPLFATP